MNKRGDLTCFLIVSSIFLGILLLTYFIVLLLNNFYADGNCRLMKEEGFNTSVKHFGLGLNDCYIDSVPYDRFILVKNDK